MSTKPEKRRRDRFRDREASRYAHPIASRELILEVLGEHGSPLSIEMLSAELGLTRERDVEALRRRLGAMERDGQIIRNRREGYGRVDKMDLVRGRVIGHRDGFGFLVPDEGGDDLYLSSRQMRSLMHGDRAVARVVGRDRLGRREGAVVEVLERANERIVGRFFREAGIGLVRPDNARIAHEVLVPPEETGGAGDGDIVVVEITEHPGKRNRAAGRVVEVLGAHMAPGMEIDVALRVHGLPEKWPPAALEEAARLGTGVTAADAQGRVDLRDTALVTIDGEDARDFDDAVWCDRTPSGWRLVVAIADVAAYVASGSALDAEARARGNSAYFPDRVIPMLPEALSNGLCSLVPDEDRLCLACEMLVGRDGEVRRSRFFEAVMRSHARLTYDEVAGAVVRRDRVERRRLGTLAARLDELYRLYKAFARSRTTRGAIEIDAAETRIVLGADRRVERIEPRLRNDAHRIIEECMIAANVAAARFLQRHRLPTLYRVHEPPPPDKLEELRAFLAELGLKLGGGDRPEPRHLAALIRRTTERPDAHLVQTVVLRSMSQAVYSPANVGHFGLAHAAYVHFTSPIRRYPDLLVHRAIKHALAGGRPGRFAYSPAEMVAIGEHTSMTERRADEATRDAVAWLKCEFMLDKVGSVFEGIVTGVAPFGIFVTLDGIYVEGLVHVSALGYDYFHFDAAHHRLSGERSGRTYRLADRVRVRVVRVDLDAKRVDFEPADRTARGAPEPRRGRRRRR